MKTFDIDFVQAYDPYLILGQQAKVTEIYRDKIS
jgi:hypothetical protein